MNDVELLVNLQKQVATLMDHCERLRQAMHVLTQHEDPYETCADLGCIQHRALKAELNGNVP